MNKANQRKKQAARGRQSPVALFLLILGGLLVLTAVVVTVLSGGRSAGTPALAVDQEVIDLGAVKLGEPVRASFTLTNTGDAPLRFSEPPYIEVREGC